jgi:hypothetical protein
MQPRREDALPLRKLTTAFEKLLTLLEKLLLLASTEVRAKNRDEGNARFVVTYRLLKGVGSNALFSEHQLLRNRSLAARRKTLG